MICLACNQEMMSGLSCVDDEYRFPDQVIVTRIRNGGERCHDCAAPPGGLHHPGCDAETCPRCGGQVISCGCGRGYGDAY